MRFLFTFIIIFISVFFFSSRAQASTIVTDDITANTEWDLQGSPYVVENPVTVTTGATLTIDAGVIVKFDFTNLNVFGSIIANGTSSQPVIFTSLADDIGGDTNSDGNDSAPSAGDWGGIYISDATGTSALHHAQLRYFSENFTVQDTPAFALDHVTLSDAYGGITLNAATADLSAIIETNIFSDGMDIYGGSHITANGFQNDEGDEGILVYGASTFDGTDIEISDGLGDAFEAYQGSTATLSASTISDSLSEVFGGATLSATDTVFHNGFQDGIDVFQQGTLTLDHSTIQDFFGSGIADFGNGENPIPDTLTIANTKIIGNDVGIDIYDAGDNTPSQVSISNNSIHDNISFGARTFTTTATVPLQHNWWGSASGPTNASNPQGTGDIVADHIDFSNWLLSDPLAVSNNSNVLFIPGFEGSRLYKVKGTLNIKDQLWEPDLNSDVTDLSMTSAGVSQNSTIYTRDIIGRTNIFAPEDENIYQSFEDSLDAMVASRTINSWAAAPYDWRYDPEYTVNHGIVDNSGNINYESTLSQNQVPFIISQLSAMALSSATGKVTIVTHSNGGLVVKALIRKLQAMHDTGTSDLVTKIDKVIMVAVPQLGTPQAIGSLLHGDKTEVGGGFIVSQSTARDFGENVPGAYALLPSEKYFDTVTTPVIKFDSSLDSINNFHTMYGDSITTYHTMKNFLLGILDQRTVPASANTVSPSILNSTILNNADTVHSDLDSYNFPSSIQVYKIAGWGQTTASGVQYLTKQACSLVCATILDEKMIPTSDGDDTVVTPSVTYGGGVNYYVNLWQYHTDTGKNNKHADIFETAPVINEVKNIVTGDSSLPQYVTTTKPSGTDNLMLSTHSPVTLDVYDSAGRHTGISATQGLPDFQQVDEQIPNSAYIPFGEGTYVSVPTGGAYTINISGTDFGTFTFEKEHDVNDVAQADTASFTDVPVTPTTNAMLTMDSLGNPSVMQIDTNGDGIIDQTISAGAAFDPIAYLEMMKSTVISMDMGKKVEDEFVTKIDKLESDIRAGKIKKAEVKIKILMAKMKYSKHGHKKHIDNADKQAILDMFNQLINNLN